MVNVFLRHDMKDLREGPARVYFRLPQSEDADDAVTDFYETISMESFPPHLRTGQDFVGFYDKARISILQHKRMKSEPRLVPGDLALEDESPWFRAELRPASGVAVMQYHNLFAAPVPVAITGTVDPVQAAIADEIERHTSLDSVPDAATTDIQKALSLSGSPAGVAVYDVGQGNCNAVLDPKDMPLLYFDLGGGVLWHEPHFPAAMTGLCFTLDQNIVLSHWDWDHWSMGLRFHLQGGTARALSTTWIAPRQKIGTVHASLAAGIVRHGRLLLWPRGAPPSLNSGHLTLHKCSHAGRNHSGLMLEVANPADTAQRILLTGDGRYTAHPALLPDYHSVVAPHHGADMHVKHVPSAGGSPAGRCAYSVGDPNLWSYVKPVTETRHQAAGWPLPVVRKTSAKATPGRLGHIGLYWSVRPPAPAMLCGGLCSLKIEQT